MAENYKLPNGTVTLDFDDYLAAWNAIAEPLAAAAGCSVLAFDPDIQLRGQGTTFAVPFWAAERIVSRLQPNNQVERPGNPVRSDAELAWRGGAP